MTRVKVCGVTSLADAGMCVDAGVDAIGLNFSPLSRRRVDLETALEIADELRAHVLIVGVFVDQERTEIERIRERIGLGCVQLHGSESPELVAAFLPHAYKAIRARDAGVVEEARRFPGDHILIDAYVEGEAGGSGRLFPWQWVVAIPRKVTLAGGLTPENVARAIEVVRPYCVDVASGVESAVGVKDAAKVAAFVKAAREGRSPTE